MKVVGEDEIAGVRVVIKQSYVAINTCESWPMVPLFICKYPHRSETMHPVCPTSRQLSRLVYSLLVQNFTRTLAALAIWRDAPSSDRNRVLPPTLISFSPPPQPSFLYPSTTHICCSTTQPSFPLIIHTIFQHGVRLRSHHQSTDRAEKPTSGECHDCGRAWRA